MAQARLLALAGVALLGLVAARDEPYCNIERLARLSPADYRRFYRDQRPFIITGGSSLSASELDAAMQTAGQRPALASSPSDSPLTHLRAGSLSEVFNAGLERPWMEKPHRISGPLAALGEQRAGERWLWSDDQDYAFDSGTLTRSPGLERLVHPPKALAEIFQTSRRVSGCAPAIVGAGPTWSGLPWHFHETVEANLLLSGRKRWGLRRTPPPGGFNPRRPAWEWFERWLPELLRDNQTAFASLGETAIGDDAGQQEVDDPIFVCEQRPGEAIYVPDGWYHTTLNTEPVVMSTLACATGGGPSGTGPHAGNTTHRSLVTAFGHFPLRIPFPGFSEGLPWSIAMPWQTGTALAHASTLQGLLARPGVAHNDPMLGTLLAAGAVGQAAAAVHGARQALMAPATRSEAQAFAALDPSGGSWGGLSHRTTALAFRGASVPPYSSTRGWTQHALAAWDSVEGSLATGGQLPQRPLAARAAMCSRAPPGGSPTCDLLFGGGLSTARLQPVPHQLAANPRARGPADSIVDEQVAAALAATLEVGAAAPSSEARHRAQAQLWAEDVLRRPAAAVGVTRAAVAIRAVLLRPTDKVAARLGSVFGSLPEGSAWLDAVGHRGARRAPPDTIWDSLNAATRGGAAWAHVATSTNPRSADAHAILATSLSLLGREEEAALAALEAMRLNERDVASCTRLARLFLRAAVGAHLSADGRGGEPLTVRILSSGWAGAYDAILNRAKADAAAIGGAAAPLVDLLREGAASRGQLAGLAPLTPLGPWGDLAVARRVCGECLRRAGVLMALGRSPDQSSVASGEAFEVATMSRVFATLRSIDVPAALDALGSAGPTGDAAWHSGIKARDYGATELLHSALQSQIGATAARSERGLEREEASSASQTAARSQGSLGGPDDGEEEDEEEDEAWQEVAFDGDSLLHA